jgi:hypothetical protein
MFEDAVKKAEAGARAEAIREQLREETWARPATSRRFAHN